MYTCLKMGVVKAVLCIGFFLLMAICSGDGGGNVDVHAARRLLHQGHTYLDVRLKSPRL